MSTATEHANFWLELNRMTAEKDATIASLRQEVETLKGAMRASDERLIKAGERVGINYGCDVAEHMADELEELIGERKQSRDEWVRARKEVEELREALKEARDMVNVFEQITPYTDPRSQVLKAVLARIDSAIAAATRSETCTASSE